MHKQDLDRELDQEMAFHLAEQKAEYMAAGMSEREADAAARRLFGSAALIEQECRDSRGTRWVEDFIQDVRFAVRTFAKSPAFTLMAVLTLALGIGANSAFFTVASGILFRPLPYPSPDRLVAMEEGITGVGPVVSLRELSRAVDYAGYTPNNDMNLQSGGEATKVRATVATWNLPRVLGVSPARGRWFLEGEELDGRHRVAVLSDRMWRDRFGADAGVLGRKIRLDEEPFEIVGIMAPSFAFPSPDTDLWIPVRIDPRDIGYVWGGGFCTPIGRLRSDATPAQAKAELHPTIDRIRALFPWKMPDDWCGSARAVSYPDSLTKDVRPKLLALTGATLLLLLIACGNVANLLLARAVGREREFAMREALGAGRLRLLRQLLTENFVLVIAAAVVGLATAAIIIDVLPLLLPRQTPRIGEVGVDGWLVWVVVAGGIFTLITFSAAPVFRVWRSHRESLIGRTMTTSRRSSRISVALIAGELALATTLLIGAALMGRTLWKLGQVDAGVHTQNVTSARVSTGPSRCATPAKCQAFLDDLSRTLVALPSVQSVSWANYAPLDGEFSAVSSDVQDHPRPPGAPAYVIWQTAATPGYFRALGIRLLAGRWFNDADRIGSAPVVMVSESTAKRFWPDQNPIGKRIRPMSDRDWKTVIGVVGNVEQYSLTGFPSWVDGVQYVPLAQVLPRVAQSIQLTVLLQSSQPHIGELVTGAVRRQYADVVVSRILALEGVRAESVADQRSTAWLLGLLAMLGLLLGIAGVYGVIAHRVAQRKREIGIRIAMGASARGVTGMVLGETLLVAGIGSGLGVMVAFGLSRFLAALVFGVTTHDPAAFAMCPLVLIAAALTAAMVPGARAARTDPAVTLREE